jgi:hypothetical protein
MMELWARARYHRDAPFQCEGGRMIDEGSGTSNIEALKAAGVIHEELPPEYHEVFEGLSDEELGVVLTVKARLDAIKGRRGADVGGYQGFVAF